MVLNEEKMEPATQNVALTIDQMRSLMSLGMNCDDASMVYHPVSQHCNIFNLRVTNIEDRKDFWDNPRRVAIVGEDYYNRVYGRDVPAYTADDILRKIPKEIAICGIKHHKDYFFVKLSPINPNSISEKNNLGNGIIEGVNIV